MVDDEVDVTLVGEVRDVRDEAVAACALAAGGMGGPRLTPPASLVYYR